MNEIDRLKKLAGIDTLSHTMPSVENISHTAQALKDKEKILGLKPGDPDWFKLWFSLPHMTGSVDSKFRGRKK
jgi:hypothetical protein